MKFLLRWNLLFLSILPLNIFSQTEKINEYLKMVNEGKITEVKLVLPDLLAEYPNDPGVQFLHASVLEDASKAVEIYERIIRNFPQSEFSDQCFWKIIQYYVIKGEIERAVKEYENYKKTFPNSAFITPAGDLIRTATLIAKTLPSRWKSDKKEVETQDMPKEPEIKKIEQTPKKGTFGLQVGLYSTIEAAKVEVERFKSMRLRADIFTKQIDNYTMYAVVIGDYPTREKAEAEKPIVQAKCGCNPIIFQK